MGVAVKAATDPPPDEGEQIFASAELSVSWGSSAGGSQLVHQFGGLWMKGPWS